jgi:hypothetical protein
LWTLCLTHLEVTNQGIPHRFWNVLNVEYALELASISPDRTL